MVDRSLVKTIRDEYPETSWALWSREFPDPGCVEETPTEVAPFLVEHHEELISDVVFLGLNRSADLEAPLTNFHAPFKQPHNDYYLKEFVQDAGLTRLLGGFMTDLVDKVEPDSTSVSVTGSDGDQLFDQLELLGADRYHIVCFGNKVFEGLTDYLGAS